MKRRNLLLGSISAAAVAVVGKNAVKTEPEPKMVTWFEEWNPADGTTYGVIPESASGYQLQQIAALHGIHDKTLQEHLLAQPWYQELLREQVLREMYPPLILTRPDGSTQYIDTPLTAYRDPQLAAYGYIDAPYQAKRKAAMDAKFALDTNHAEV